MQLINPFFAMHQVFYCERTPICIAVRPVPLRIEERVKLSVLLLYIGVCLRVCIAIRLPLVSRCSWENTGGWVAGIFPVYSLQFPNAVVLNAVGRRRAQMSANERKQKSANARAQIRGRHGGVEKGGGWKTSRMTPLPKRGFGPPLVRYVFHPPQVSVLCFPVQKSTTEQTRSCFGGVQKFLGERVLWYVFLPPYVLHPPISRPKQRAQKLQTTRFATTRFAVNGKIFPPSRVWELPIPIAAKTITKKLFTKMLCRGN